MTSSDPFRGFSGVWPVKLNKRTGWESRTVPPLYMLMVIPFGESRSLGQPGKAGMAAEKSARHESEDLRRGASARRGIRCVLLSQKNGCGVFVTPQPICFQEEKI